MYLEQRMLPNATILDCFGQLIQEDHEELMERFESLQSEGCRHLIINMTSLYHLDPHIISLLDFFHEYLTSAGGKLTLISPLSAVRRILEEGGVPEHIPTFLTLYDALHRRNVARVKSERPIRMARTPVAFSSTHERQVPLEKRSQSLRQETVGDPA